LQLPLFGESLQSSQVDRLSEAHAADERSNSYSALPNRPAKVRLGMGLRGNISCRVTSNLIEPILPNAALMQGSTRAIVAAFFIGEGVVLSKNHTRLPKRENATNVWG